jgi:hypothetical protein
MTPKKPAPTAPATPASTAETVTIRYDGPSHLLDVGGGQVIPRGGTGEVTAELAEQLAESDWADITVADAKGKLADLAEPLPPAEPPPAEPTPAQVAADMPVLGDDAETPNETTEEV